MELLEKENPVFNRKEISMEIESDVSPKIQDVLKAVSEQFKTPEENIKIKKINARFGSKNFIIDANIYPSKEEKDSLERKSKKEDKMEKIQSEAQTQTQEETKEEIQPVEEQKAEEAPKEETKPVEEQKTEEEPQGEASDEDKPTEQEERKGEVENQELAKPDEEPDIKPGQPENKGEQ